MPIELYNWSYFYDKSILHGIIKIEGINQLINTEEILGKRDNIIITKDKKEYILSGAAEGMVRRNFTENHLLDKLMDLDKTDNEYNLYNIIHTAWGAAVKLNEPFSSPYAFLSPSKNFMEFPEGKSITGLNFEYSIIYKNKENKLNSFRTNTKDVIKNFIKDNEFFSIDNTKISDKNIVVYF